MDVCQPCCSSQLLVCDAVKHTAMAHSQVSQTQVGFLMHVEHSVPKLPVLEGSNIFGRDNFRQLSDKRLSRKHFTIITSPDGPAVIVVEGTNPVVVNRGGQRNKLCSGEKGCIGHEDIIELIPGNHFYKYVACTAPDDKNRMSSKEGENLRELVGRKQKRIWRTSEDEDCETNLKAGVKRNYPIQANSMFSKNRAYLEYSESGRFKAIQDSFIFVEKLPLTFRLLQVKSLPAWANSSSISIGDVIQGNILVAILSNYMIDIDWLLSACPGLTKVPHVFLIHGEGDGAQDLMKKKMPANWILHKPPLPISYGTYHSKAMLLVYPRGVRIVVHTANLIYVDWNNKSQGLWMQDFPWKLPSNSCKGCAFENDLVDYLNALRCLEFPVTLPALGNFNINPSFFKRFDYSSSKVRLIASVPGYHTGSNLKKWGHIKLQNVLQECFFDKVFHKAPLVYQFSSLGSLDEKWMAELASSMSSGFLEDKTPLGLGEPLIIWPTVEDVRCSLEGYAAGSAIPSPEKNVDKEFLKKYWAKWKAGHTGRCRAMPHIKTYVRYNGQDLAWVLLTSANLSKAAWGALQKNKSQLMVRSYELGVLFLPSVTNPQVETFSCIDDEKVKSLSRDCKSRRTKLVTLGGEGNGDTDSSSSLAVPFPLPYELPPQPYSSEDVPWSWDRRYVKEDVYGQIWPMHHV